MSKAHAFFAPSACCTKHAVEGKTISGVMDFMQAAFVPALCRVPFKSNKSGDELLGEFEAAFKSLRESHDLLDNPQLHLSSADELDNIKLLGKWAVVNDEVVKKKKSLLVNDIRDNILFSRKSLPFSHKKLPIYSFLAVPLEKDKKIIGVLMVSNSAKAGHCFGEEDRTLLLNLSNRTIWTLSRKP